MRTKIKDFSLLTNGWGDGSGQAFLIEELYLAEEWISFIETCVGQGIKSIQTTEAKSINFELGDFLFGFFDFEKNNFFISYKEGKELDCQINEINAEVLKDILT